MPRHREILASLIFAAIAGAADAAPVVTIIIDDLGYAFDAGRRTVGLPGPVVCAVLPQTPRGRELAELAHANGKEVLLHLPMQAMDGDDGEDDDELGRIVLDMTQRSFAEAIERNIESVPHIIGINGHRGSLLTRHPGHMQWLMDELIARDLVFVDSYTTHLSIALRLAREAGVPATRRHVFLDGDQRPAAIAREFDRLIGLAKARGSAVAIGHPHAATLDFLEHALPTLSARGVTLVGLRVLLEAQPPTPQSANAALGSAVSAER